jgi:hypothetical protein
MHKCRRQKGLVIQDLTDELDVRLCNAAGWHADLDDDARHET